MGVDLPISEESALELARRHLASLLDEIEITEVARYHFGWIFSYRLRGTGEIAGNAPLLVERASGAVQTLGTSHPVDWHVENFLATGDVHTSAGRTVELQSLEPGARAHSAVQAIRALSELGLGSAKNLVEAVLAGQRREIVALSPEAAVSLVRELGGLGFRAKRIADRKTGSN